MKKMLLLFLTALLLIVSGAAYATDSSPTPSDTPLPTPSPNPTFSPAPVNAPVFSGLIGLNATQNATAEDIVRVQIRLRDLHYFSFKPTGRFQSMTANAAKAFQIKHTDDNGTPLISDGTIGPQTMDILFRHNTIRSDIAASIPIGSSQPAGGATPGAIVEWPEIKSKLAIGTAYLITDYNSGATFYMVYSGGENHAEMECKDTLNSDTLKQVFGGEYNFSKRAVTISVNGKQIAASMQGWPHGTDSYPSNDMNGHVCLFFSGSLSHVGSLPDAEHQEFIYKASGK